MKTHIILLTIIAASFSFLSACSTSSPVMAASGGLFTVTKTGTTGFTPVGTLRTDAYEAANQFAAKKGMVAEVVSVNEVRAGFGKFPQVDLRFRLTSASAREAGTKAPAISIAGQAAYDAEGRQSTGETTVVLNKEVDVYAELKKIGDLKDKGILTDEEFQREKERLLKANR